jgi:hypothetical protein
VAEGEYFVEMLWKCSSCNHRNRGRDLICSACGNPKDGTEEYEMPGNTAPTAAVRSPELLNMAQAAPNWRCKFCGSDQRAYDGSCDHCGAGKKLSAHQTPSAHQQNYHRPGKQRSGRTAQQIGKALIILAVCGMGGSMLMSLVGFLWFSVQRNFNSPDNNRVVLPRVSNVPDVPKVTTVVEDMSVQSVSWRHTIVVDRWRLLTKSGFEADKPISALQVQSSGQRVHHTDKVSDGYREEHYTETVPDGTRSESYTTRESCGQTCTTSPRTCRNKCTSQKNGFAKCTNVCTGGNRTCRTKTCTVTKTRQVPKTKVVTKTRQIPKFKDVPRYATWYTWKQWGWGRERSIPISGTTMTVSWPSDKDVALNKGVIAPEKERTSKSTFYEVKFVNKAGEIFSHYPKTLEEFTNFPINSSYQIRVHLSDKRIEILSKNSAPSPPSSP